MRHLILSIAVLASPVNADDTPKPDDKPAEKKDSETKPIKPDPKPKMLPAGQISGRVVTVKPGLVTIEVSVPYVSGRRIREYKKKENLKLADDVQVFWHQLPVELDDKGRPKKPDPKDVKKQVRGPGGLTGYATETENLRGEQQVIAVLQQKKDRPKTGVKKSDDAKDDENKPVVAAIYILFEPKR